MPAVTVEGVDQFDLLFVDGREAGIQVHDAAEYGHGHTGHDDGGRRGAQPYDEKRRQCGLRQAVQDDQVGLQNLRETPAAPEQHGGEDADSGHQQETDNGFIQGDADVEENGPVHGHFIKAQCDPGGAAEDKGIDDPLIRAELPEEEKEDQDEDPGGAHGDPVAAESPDEEGLAVGRCVSWGLQCVFLSVHRGSAPSIFH